MSNPNNNNNKAALPAWYYLLRAIFSLGIGALLILHETVEKVDPPGPFVIVVGLLLMGFAPEDFRRFFNAMHGE